MTNRLPPDLIDNLKAALGAPYVLTEEADTVSYNTEWRGLFPGKSTLVVRPGSTEEVAQIVRLCAAHKIPIVPQGGNTGLVGGQVSSDPNSVVVSLSRLNRIRQMDAAGFSLIAEAGVTLGKVQEAAEKEGRLFALSLPSEGSCQVGGTVSTNAGGMNALLYGMMRSLVFGLEVVLADGKIWNGLRTLRKDNSGYDLKQLFIGAEGTLGIVTAAALKLHPLPHHLETAFIATPSMQTALLLVSLIQDRFPQQLSRCELVPEIGLQMVLKNVAGTRRALEGASLWYVVIELAAGKDNELRGALSMCLEAGLEQGIITDAAIAETRQQRQDFWRLREELSEAQRNEGGSIKLDISVPLAKTPEFIDRAARLLEQLCPGARSVPFGHLGDGNIHYDICQPLNADKAEFLGRWDEISDALHHIVVDFGGSIAAEHGVGSLKPAKIAAVKSPVEIELMKKIKIALDPHNLLNPGKVLEG